VFGREVHTEHEIQELKERYDRFIIEGEGCITFFGVNKRQNVLHFKK
jgi:Ca2+-binding EF-hand superfamily protein